MIICKICNKEYKSLQSLSKHICVHNIIPKEYFDLYLNINNEGNCCICGNKTTFLSLSRGYRKTCSHSCHATLQNTSYTNEQANIINSKRKETWSKKDMNSYSNLQSKIQKIRWDNCSNIDRQNHAQRTKDGLVNLSEFTKNEMNKKRSISMKCYFNNLSEDEKLQYKHRVSESVKEWYKNNPDKVKEMNINRQKAFDNMSIEKKKLINDKRINTFANKSKEEKSKSYEKSIITKKEKGTINTSKLEKYVENQLKLKFSNICTQYKSIKYPWFCDFYIPDLDLYIECHFHWTHGTHPYNENIDYEEALLLKSKNSKYYDAAYYVWTKLDVKKLSIAKENNLNYLCFYSIKEFNNWFEQI